MGLRGDRVRQVREQRGYTQAEVAEIVGVGTQQMTRWENGKTDPASDDVFRLAKALGVTSDYLLGLSDEAPPDFIEENLSPMEHRLIVAMRQGLIVEALETFTALSKDPEQTIISPDEPAIER